MTGVTLTTYRQFVARELGLFVSSTAASSSTTSALADTAWPVKSTLDQADLYQDTWLFRPNASTASDKVRIVKTYDPNAGTLTPDLPWTNAPSNGEAYELHAVVEPLTALAACINEALKRCLLVVEVTLTPTASQTRQSLSAHVAWLLEPSQVLQVGYLSSGESREQTDPYARSVRGQVVFDGGVPYLETPGMMFQSTSTLYLRVVKRAYDECAATAGSYGGQSGLSLESDKAPERATVEWVGAATLVEVWRRYSQVLETSSRARLAPNRAEAAARFTKLTRTLYLASKPARTFRPLLSGGPRPAQTTQAYRASTA